MLRVVFDNPVHWVQRIMIVSGNKGSFWSIWNTEAWQPLKNINEKACHQLRLLTGENFEIKITDMSLWLKHNFVCMYVATVFMHGLAD